MPKDFHEHRNVHGALPAYNKSPMKNTNKDTTICLFQKSETFSRTSTGPSQRTA